jgi:hypothetical protein
MMRYTTLSASVLPRWLRNTRIVVREHRPLEIDLQVLRRWTGKIQSGDSVDTSTGYGTLGLIMSRWYSGLQGRSYNWYDNGHADMYSARAPAQLGNSVAREIALLILDPKAHKKLEKTTERVDMYSYQRSVNPANFTDSTDLNFRIRASQNLFPPSKDQR